MQPLKLGLLSAHQGGHVCIDPYQEKQYLNAGLDNLVRFEVNKSSWDDFNEFYTLRGIMTHILIRPIVHLLNR
jgi:hypothetical protein